MAKKSIAIVLMIVGAALLIGVGLFALDSATSAKPVGLGTWIFTVLGLLLGASTGIKGWLEWNQKEAPPQVMNINASDNAQIAIGEYGRNIKLGDNSQYIENFHEAPKTERGFSNLHQLPPPPADFTGRELLISQLLEDFSSHKGTTISGLTGMGGIGKTALGLVVAQQIAENYRDAQIFLDLNGTTAPLSSRDIARHVITAFEPKADLSSLDESSLWATYQSVLYGRKVLLYFDNARSAEQIAKLTPPQSGAMLVTSRWTFSVPGLQSRRVDVMSANDAIRFLLKLCPRIDDKAANLAKACAYLPLALRIGGSFLQVNDDLPVEKYLSELSDGKKRLEIFKKSREQAEIKSEPDLFATFELSYNALSEEVRKRWRMLGVFPSSFDMQGAQAIWQLNEESTHTLLSTLHNYSILEHDRARYYLHDLMRDYARAEILDQESEDARLRHATYYLEILRFATNTYREGGANTLVGLGIFDAEWLNIASGQNWVATQHEASDQIARLCSDYGSMPNLLSLRLNSQVTILWFESALLANKLLGDRINEAKNLGNLGVCYRELSDFRKAIGLYRAQLYITREIDDHLGEADALRDLGICYKHLGKPQKAIEFYQQALKIYREEEHERGQASILTNLGNVFTDFADPRRAIEVYQQALAIVRKLEDSNTEAIVLVNLGRAYANLGEFRQAIEFHEQALTIDREMGDRSGQAIDLDNLGWAYFGIGEVRLAIEYYQQALALAETMGDRISMADFMNDLGAAYASLGDTIRAVEFCERALIIVREIGDRHVEGNALGNLGSAYRNSGDVLKGKEFSEQQLIIVREIGDRRGEGNALSNLGLAYADWGDAKKAIEFYEHALAIAREIGDRHSEGNALFNMGLSLYSLNQKLKAAESVRSALEILEAIESPNAESIRNKLKEWDALE